MSVGGNAPGWKKLLRCWTGITISDYRREWCEDFGKFKNDIPKWKIDIWSIKEKECVREVKKDRPKEILLGVKRTIEANSRS